MSDIDSLQGESHHSAPRIWRVRGRDLVVHRPVVVGIVNVTPDSFSDGGQLDSVEKAVARARRMVADGADILDIGGESTRPQNAIAVSEEEESRRVLPVVRAVRAAIPDVPISVDTTKSAIAEAALRIGAEVVNDVSGLRLDPRMRDVVAETGAGVVLMHSRGGVNEMGTYRHAEYADVTQSVLTELRESLDRAERAGIDRSAIVIDPGIGFAKRSEHSIRILFDLPRLAALGYPVLIGVSRKRFIGELSGVMDATERAAGTLGANVAGLMRGARLFRVHDVAVNRQALDVAWGILQATDVAARARSTERHLGSRFPVPGSRLE